jgi:hypothetical protein
VYNSFDLIVLSAIFSNISAISWRPVVVVEEAEVPGDNQHEQGRIIYVSSM